MKEMSRVVQDDRDWIDSNENKPAVNKSVVIRMVKPDVSVTNNESDEIYFLEEAAVGKWTGDHWEIDPPYHKYPISSMMDHEKLTDGVNVSHWSEPNPGEVDGWAHRLDLFNTYNQLDITIDPDKEESLYRALSLGAALIESIYPQYSDYKDSELLRNYYMALKDIQFTIDMKAGDNNALDK